MNTQFTDRRAAGRLLAGRLCAVEPLERTSEWEQGELAETFPSGI